MGLSYCQTLAQAIAIAADGIHAASQATSEALTGAVDLGKFPHVMFILDVGVEGTAATVDFQIKGCATSGGSYVAIPLTAITQFVKATNDGNYAVVSITDEYVNSLNLGYKFIKGSLLPGTAASLASVIVLGASTDYEPAKKFDSVKVAQTLQISNAGIFSSTP